MDLGEMAMTDCIWVMVLVLAAAADTTPSEQDPIAPRPVMEAREDVMQRVPLNVAERGEILVYLPYLAGMELPVPSPVQAAAAAAVVI